MSVLQSPLPPLTRSGAAPWLKPLPMVLLVFVCFALLRVSVFHPTLLKGNDFFWHLEYGYYILDHGALPESDWLTWTFEGKPYQITQWLGEVLMALAVRLGGPLMLSVMMTASACATLFFAWRTALLYISHRTLALSLAAFTVFPLLVMSARPQVFGLLAFSVLVWLLAVWFERKAKWALVGMSAVMVLWVNLHGSFIIGVLYIAALGGAAWLASFVEMKGKFVASVQAHGPLVVASFAAIFAVLLNPYGWRAFECVYQISQLKTTTSGVISEWQATSLTTANGPAFYLIVLTVLMCITFAKQRPTVPTMLGFVGTVYFGMQADRQSLIAMLALVPFIAKAVKDTRIEAELGHKLSLAVPLWKAALAVVLTLGASVGLHNLAKEMFVKHHESDYPVKVMRFLDDNNIQGKIFNRLEHGGYIASLGRKSFVDGRLDLFGDDMTFDTYHAALGKPGWEVLIDKYKPDLFVLEKTDVLVELLTKTKGCKTLFSDVRFVALSCTWTASQSS
jgi:hypothetical protein